MLLKSVNPLQSTNLCKQGLYFASGRIIQYTYSNTIAFFVIKVNLFKLDGLIIFTICSVKFTKSALQLKSNEWNKKEC